MTAARSGRASGIPLSRSGHAENIPPEACFGDALAPIGRQRLSLGFVPLPHSPSPGSPHGAPSRGFSFCHPSRLGAVPPVAACLVYGLGHLLSLPLRTLPAPFPRCRTESRPQPLVLLACAMQCGASPIAARCDGQCSVLRFCAHSSPWHFTVSSARLPTAVSARIRSRRRAPSLPLCPQ